MNPVVYSSKDTSWRTPDVVLDLVRKIGPIVLDPCASQDMSHWFARWNYTKHGLVYPWYVKERIETGVTYVNPPYGRTKIVMPWIEKTVTEKETCNNIIMLLASRTDRSWFEITWHYANAVCFWNGRLRFVGAKNDAPFPSVLFYFGTNPFKFCSVFCSVGIVKVLNDNIGGHRLL